MTTISFETEVCSRCGGCGEYSYNQVDGSRCYGCNGKGKKLTKRARIAYDRMIAARQIRLGDVVPGMVIRSGGSTYNVQSVKQDTVSSGSFLKDGVMVPSAPSLHVYGLKHGMIAWADFMVELVPSKAQNFAEWTAAIEYQNSLTKAGTPRKQAA